MCTACLICFISTVTGCSNKKEKKRKEKKRKEKKRKEKKRKEEAYLWKAVTSSGHITNLKQSNWRLSISMVGSHLTRFFKVSEVKVAPQEDWN